MQVYFLYAPENEDVALEFLQHFHHTNIRVESNPSAAILEQKIQDNPSLPVVMLISDNFLRSLAVMERLSVIIQDNSPNLIPVLVEGRRMRKDGTEAYESYPTKIGTIHEVMQYRDYWYEEWIRLRKLCNGVEGDALDILEHQKSVAKRISTNIGTFLRNINGLQPLSWEAFSAYDFKTFLEKLDIERVEISNETAVKLQIVEDVKIVEETPLHVLRDEEPAKEEKVLIEETPNTETLVTEEILEVLEVQEEQTVETPVVVLPIVEPKEEKTEEPKEEPTEEPVLMVEIQEEPKEESIVLIEEPVLNLEPKEEPKEEPVLVLETKEEPVEEVSTIKEEALTEHIETVLKEELVEEALTLETIEETLNHHEKIELVEMVEETSAEHKEEGFLSRGLDGADSIDENAVYENVKPEEVTDLDVLFYLAETETEEGDMATARRCYERILKLSPVNGRALLWLARLLDKHFENEAATVNELYKKALLCNEDSAQLYYEYGLHLQRNFGSKQRSADMFLRALELNPAFDPAYMALAEVQQELGQAQFAKANYLQACLINPQYRSAEADTMYGVYAPTPISDLMEEEEKIEEALMLPTKHPNEDTVVMVTGATSGIGRSVAELFALNGFKVIITGRRVERLKEMKEELAARFPVQIEALSFDVRNREEMENALENLPEEWKNIDILINNAGLAKGRAPIHQGSLLHWETMIDTNIKGLLYLTRAITPGMVARGKGFIINVGSIAGKEAYPDGNVYCATKAAVDMLTKTLRLDLYKHGVRVSAVHPGHVETEFALVRFDGDEEKANIYEHFTPLTALDVAETIYYIATRPARVDIQDVVMFSSQQASATALDTSGKKYN